MAKKSEHELRQKVIEMEAALRVERENLFKIT